MDQIFWKTSRSKYGGSFFARVSLNFKMGCYYRKIKSTRLLLRNFPTFVDFCGKHFIYKINPQADTYTLLSDKSDILSTEASPSSGYFGILLLQSNVCT